jgi:hypothetical protein
MDTLLPDRIEKMRCICFAPAKNVAITHQQCVTAELQSLQLLLYDFRGISPVGVDHNTVYTR